MHACRCMHLHHTQVTTEMVIPLCTPRRLGHHPGQLLGQLSEQLEPHVDSLGSKQLTLVAWSLAKLGGRGAAESRLLDAIAAVSVERAHEFTPLVRRASDVDWFGRRLVGCYFAPEIASSNLTLSGNVQCYRA